MVRKVAVIMGSDSDWLVVKGACAQLKALDIPFEAHILSAHRTPAEAAAFARSAKANGFGVILCAAGITQWSVTPFGFGRKIDGSERGADKVFFSEVR